MHGRCTDQQRGNTPNDITAGRVISAATDSRRHVWVQTWRRVQTAGWCLGVRVVWGGEAGARQVVPEPYVCELAFPPPQETHV